MNKEEKESIANVIADIMVNDGPDGHCDGSDIIADFIEAVIDDRQKEWLEEYYSKKPRHFKK